VENTKNMKDSIYNLDNRVGWALPAAHYFDRSKKQGSYFWTTPMPAPRWLLAEQSKKIIPPAQLSKTWDQRECPRLPFPSPELS
jgi:hypothetical protein